MRAFVAWLVGSSLFSALMAWPFALDSRGFRSFDGTIIPQGWGLFWHLFLGGMIICSAITAAAGVAAALLIWATRTR